MPKKERNFSQIKHSQVDQLIRLGISFHFGISELAYKESIPDIPPQPPGKYAKQFPVPVLVDPRLTLGQCAQIAHMKERLSGTSGASLLKGKECNGFSDIPYWIWCGVDVKGWSGKMKKLHAGRRWINATEGTFFLYAAMLTYSFYYLMNPVYFTCPGTQYIEEAGKVSCVILEKSIKNQLIDGLGLGWFGIGWVAEKQYHENPASIFQLNSSSTDFFLDRLGSPVYCAWPPHFDWSRVSVSEEQ